MSLGDATAVDGNSNPSDVEIFWVNPQGSETGTTNICTTCHDHDGLISVPRCVQVQVVAPKPVFIGAPQHKDIVEAFVNCPFSMDITAQDETDKSNGAVPTGITIHAASHNYNVKITADLNVKFSAYRNPAQWNTKGYSAAGMPTGSQLLGDDTNENNPLTRQFKWTPTRGQEGFIYRQCFVATSSISNEAAHKTGGCNTNDEATACHDAAGAAATAHCIDISVVRCQYCTNAGETLASVANDWASNWLELWSANSEDVLPNPRNLAANTHLTLGPSYGVETGDVLAILAIKMGVTVDDIKNWNPDLNDVDSPDYKITKDWTFDAARRQELCILPQTCDVEGG